MTISRRRFAALTGGALASLAFAPACDAAPFPAPPDLGRLTARPGPGVKTTARGRSALGLGSSRDGILSMPSRIPEEPMPLVVLLHGAGGSGERFLQRFDGIPDRAGLAVLALDSRGSTWDGIRGMFGPDVTFMDRALERVFGEVAVDPARLSIGGFSDGATYGLSLGMINGDLFKRVVAFSPGFVIDGELHGRPNIFMSHGISDDILPIDKCSRVIAPALRKRGYGVVLREFDGWHEVPPEVATEGLTWAASR